MNQDELRETSYTFWRLATVVFNDYGYGNNHWRAQARWNESYLEHSGYSPYLAFEQLYILVENEIRVGNLVYNNGSFQINYGA